jgi:hypothetical protein
MIPMGKIVGDLLQGFGLKIAAGAGAIYVASEVYHYLHQALEPINKAFQVLGH